jgi:hypothetical protein
VDLLRRVPPCPAMSAYGEMANRFPCNRPRDRPPISADITEAAAGVHCGARKRGGVDTRAIPAWLRHRSIISTAIYTAWRAEPVQGLLAGSSLWLVGTAPVVEGCEDGATLVMVQYGLV